MSIAPVIVAMQVVSQENERRRRQRNNSILKYRMDACREYNNKRRRYIKDLTPVFLPSEEEIEHERNLKDAANQSKCG